MNQLKLRKLPLVINHPDLLCETCYQKVTSCPLCRAPLGPTDDSDIDEANHAMFEASINGPEDIVKLMLSRGAHNYNFAMCAASYCKIGPQWTLILWSHV